MGTSIGKPRAVVNDIAKVERRRKFKLSGLNKGT